MGGGGINVFRASDIQAYTPPTGKPKAEETEQKTETKVTAPPPEESFAALGDLKQYDTDGNGKITKDEFNSTRGGELLRAKAEKEQELFKTLDANGDGKLSSDEFLKAFSNLTGDSTVAKVRDHIDAEFNQRKASDGTIHVDPKVQAGGGDNKAEKAKETEKADKTETKDYTVKGGDTMNKIAKAHGVTLAELKEANPELFKSGRDAHGKHRTAGGDLIYPGDKVKIPVKIDKKAGGGAPQATSQAELLRSVDGRLAALQGEKDKLTKDLQDPNKKAEALARMNLIEMQMAGLTGIKQHVGDYRPAANLSAEDAKKIDEVFGKIEQLTKDLSNPTKLGEVRSQLALAYNFLQNPKLYDPKAANGTTDPALLNQATATQNQGDRITKYLNEMNALIPDLAHPSRAAEADARLKQLDAQVRTMVEISWRVSDYRRPGNLNAEQTQKAADLLKQIDGQTANLSDPRKNADALAQVQKLLGELETIGK